MRVSIQGLCDLDNDLKDLIIDCWKSKKLRKFSIYCFLLEVFFRTVLDIKKKEESKQSRNSDIEYLNDNTFNHLYIK
ncbi:unnamed protein product [Rotaria sordida]|uniref:Uncharacterized protein n=1 Tax=Rotaria sordida TaxID=392033 RepID=A0A814R7K5_9BILA|nr:unnamed protein product [Rotaria sordida]